MLALATGQQALTQPEYRVFAGGTFAPGDLVEVYTDDPGLPVGRFPAQFIATGEF